VSTNLIPISTFLGKYFSELSYSATQEKYRNTGLDEFFEQRFVIQGNKVQMIVDPGLTGLVVTFAGNEVHISQEFFDHPNILVSNSLENSNSLVNPKSFYNPETFSTVAYLICQNQTTFQIVGDVDQPIYVKYRSDFETFYSSVVKFEISNDVDIEIVEEIESQCALNSVMQYFIHPMAKVSLTTFYQSLLSSISMVYRDVVVGEGATFTHNLLGRGSSNAIDENKVILHHSGSLEISAVTGAENGRFHSVLSAIPTTNFYKIDVDFRSVLLGGANVSFHPTIVDQGGPAPNLQISTINAGQNPDDSRIKDFVKDIMDRFILVRMLGVKRYYDNKSKFAPFP
jgi:hypothetical protein